METEVVTVPRRWERQAVTIPVGLVLKANHFKADDSALTIDISQHGVRVQTKLALVPGEWVGVVPKGKYSYAIPSRVVWTREDESNHSILAGLELLGTLET